MDALAMNLAKAQGWRTAFCSFENPPDLHAVKLLEKYLEMPFWHGARPRMGEGDLAIGKTFIAEHFPLTRLSTSALPPTSDIPRPTLDFRL